MRDLKPVLVCLMLEEVEAIDNIDEIVKVKGVDVLFIGSGQAGNPLTYSLAEKGWKVALIEKDQLGGTCINVGCTPTKTMVASAQVAHYVRNAARWGVNAGEAGVDDVYGRGILDLGRVFPAA